jgi:ribokinase
MSKLVNLGSLCVDLGGRRIIKKGAGETVSSLSHQIFPGGKGLNQSLAAARSGAQVVHVGCIGPDGGLLLDVLKDADVDVSRVREVPEASGHAVIQVDEQGANSIVIAGGSNRLITPEDVDDALALLENGDWLLLQNEINDLPLVLERARAAHAQVAFNVAPVDDRIAGYDYTGVDWLIVNEIEACAVASADSEPKAFDLLMKMLPESQILLTLGANGLRYGYRNLVLNLPAYDVRAMDETAAGDAFIGAFLAALIQDMDLSMCLNRASAAGALAVTRPGAATSIPTAGEIDTFLSRRKALTPR